MPAAYVTPYVKRHKNAAADAEAICEGVTRPNMRFVATKTPEQQSCLTLHRTRHLFIRQQTAVLNAIRAHLAEFGIVAPVGRQGVTNLLRAVADPKNKRVPKIARACLAALSAHLRMFKGQILEFDRMISAWHRSNKTSKELDEIPGVGPALATALVAGVADSKLSCRSSTRAAARKSLAVSASEVIVICAACLPPAHWPSSAMLRGVVPSIGLSSPGCCRGCPRQQDGENGMGP
jgi:transposase